MSTHDSDEVVCDALLGGEEQFDERAAYARFTARAKRPVRSPYVFAAGLAAAAVLAIVFAAPLGSFAQSFLTIFQPKQFAAIDVSSLRGAKLRMFPTLQEYGTFAASHDPVTSRPASLAQASAFAGFHVVSPTAVPAGLGTAHTYRATKGHIETYRFDAALARKSAAKTGQALPPMPAGLDGTKITVVAGPIVMTMWGSMRHGARDEHMSSHDSGMMVVQTVVPVIRSSGASLLELESYLLKMPGLPPAVADQIRAIGDPSTTMPIPVDGLKQSSHAVEVGGVPGLAIGDNTGIGAGVIWQRDGKVYGVFGTLTEDQVLSVATSLR